jgi:hypothetical protein
MQGKELNDCPNVREGRRQPGLPVGRRIKIKYTYFYIISLSFNNFYIGEKQRLWIGR